MEELRNLKKLASFAAGSMNQYDGEDFELPKAFKENVVEINSNTIKYNRYSAVIETRGNQHGILNIFMPNQWFYIASYFTDFYTELMKYKKYALDVTTKERLKVIGQSAQDLNQEEEAKLSSLDISDQSKIYLKHFITDYSWWGGAKTIDRGDFYVSPILNYARLVNASQSFVADLCAFLADKKDLVHLIINQEEQCRQLKAAFNYQGGSLQRIYYGAPGTGKSHAINTLTSTKSVIRTTFHPDSDYSTFVGAYKPTTEEQVRYNDSGVPVIYHDGIHKGEPIMDKVIVYDFVEQAFLKAYEEAWKKFFAHPDAPEDEFLVIEEINRGNCAQIFGDLFQLLDRNQYGYSEYPITADNDISKHLKDVFAKAQLHLDDHDVINNMYNPGNGDLAQKVLNGDILLLPRNLYIWATMNTSDQSLFPIDSAFKRRWDWKYQPITKGMDADGHDLNWKLEIDDEHQYDWWSVISNINSKIIGKLTKSEDKKLGYFFCKADSEGVIGKDIFVEKVLFCLWNEILKDFEPSQDFLKDESLKGVNDGYLSYDLFYDTTSGKTKIIGDRVNHLLANLKIEPWGDKSGKNDHTDQNG